MCKGISKNVPIEERFWLKVRKTDSCWIWLGALGVFGDARFVHKVPDLSKTSASHYSYWLHNKIKTNGLFVLHKCDNPSCVNPEHLFLGTQKDNMVDMWKKGRSGYQRGKYCPPPAPRKTHCHRGHKMSGDNLLFKKRKNKRVRVCKSCWKIMAKKWDRKQYLKNRTKRLEYAKNYWIKIKTLKGKARAL